MVAVLNPLRTARFAEEELRRTKTAAIDAPGIARFAQQKRPRAAQLPDGVTDELRELSWSGCGKDLQRTSLRQLHRAVDLGFPEFTRYVRTLESQLATTILSRYPTAASFRGVSVKKLAGIVYDGSHKIGEELAGALVEAAENSVGAYHSEPYRLRIRYLCEDLELLRRRLKDLARDVARKVDEHEIGKLMMTIEGVGPLTAACLIAELVKALQTASTRLGIPQNVEEFQNPDGRHLVTFDGAIDGNLIQIAMLVTEDAQGWAESIRPFMRPWPVVKLFREYMERNLRPDPVPDGIWELPAFKARQ